MIHKRKTRRTKLITTITLKTQKGLGRRVFLYQSKIPGHDLHHLEFGGIRYSKCSTNVSTFRPHKLDSRPIVKLHAYQRINPVFDDLC